MLARSLLLLFCFLLAATPAAGAEPSAKALLSQAGHTEADAKASAAEPGPGKGSASSLGLLGFGVLLLCGSLLGVAWVQKRKKAGAPKLATGQMRVVAELKLSQEHGISVVQMPDGHRFMIGLSQGNMTLLEPKAKRGPRPQTPAPHHTPASPSHAPDSKPVADTPKDDAFCALFEQKRQELGNDLGAESSLLEESSVAHAGLFTEFEAHPGTPSRGSRAVYRAPEEQADQGRESDSVLIALRNMKSGRPASHI